MYDSTAFFNIKDSEIIFVGYKRTAKCLEEEYENETEEERVEDSIIEEIPIRDKPTLEGEVEEILEDSEGTQEYDYIKTTERTINETNPSKAQDEHHLSVVRLKEQASVASSQGFLQQTSFEASIRNSPQRGNPGSSTSDNAPEKSKESGKEEEMELEEEEGDSDIIPPSEHAESRITSFRTSASGSRETTQLRVRKAAEEDPYQFTASQSQKEREDLEEFKKGLKAKRQTSSQAEVRRIITYFDY